MLHLALLVLAASGQADMDSLDARLIRTQQRIGDLEAQQAQAEDILLAIQEHLAVAREYYTRLSGEESALLGSIERIDARFAAADSVRSEFAASISAYLVYVYSHRDFIGPEALFASGGLSRIIRREAYLDYLARMAATRVEVLRASTDSLAHYRDSLSILREDSERLRRQMESIEQRIVQEENRQALLRLELTSEIAIARDSASALEEERMRMSALVAGLRVSSTHPSVGIPLAEPSENSYFELQRGAVEWPAEGQVIRNFGLEVHPVYGTETTSDGISVSTQASVPVLAAGPGTVMYAREFLSMGRLVIIDHCDGFYSIYAHLGEIAVSVGDEVETGSEVGVSGALPGGASGYYFEIRRGGQPVDPLGYLR
jgi:septal ring factor EnvC (AmiA/AmiB activator)